MRSTKRKTLLESGHESEVEGDPHRPWDRHPGRTVTIRDPGSRLLGLVLLAFALQACGFGLEPEPLEIVSVEATTRSPQISVIVAHRSCGVEPSVLVDEGTADVIVSAEIRARGCRGIRMESEVLVDMGEPLGDRTLVVHSAGGDPMCTIDGETSLRCTEFFVGDE